MKNKVNVLLVKYDMDKTKKRKRKNMLVEEKTEAAVILQLEKIHKGEKVQAIHDIVWDEEQILEVEKKEEVTRRHTYPGEVKFYDPEKGFGFIIPDGNMDELFFHKSAIVGEDLYDGDLVDFEVGQGPKGACAIKIKLVKDN